MPQRYLVLIDESGDPGHSASSSSRFTMTASINESADRLSDIVDSAPKGTRYPNEPAYKKELKYGTTDNENRTKILKELKKTEPRIYAVHIDKNEIKTGSATGTYHFATEKLMEQVIHDPVLQESGEKPGLIFDACNYLKESDAKSISLRIAKSEGVQLGDISCKRSIDFKPLQAHDFFAGAVGQRFVHGNPEDFLIIANLTRTYAIHPKGKKD